MSKFINLDSLREVPIPDLLARLGHYPVFRSGNELFYKSMLREENTPSLCVNQQGSVWFDHGGSNQSGIKGGTIIDLGLAYWHPASFYEVAEKISNLMAIPLSEKPRIDPIIRPVRQQLPKVPHYTINEVKPLGSHPAITRYLQSRGIWEQAQGRIKEVYYTIDDSSKQGRKFFSAGWQNDLGAWELRNKIGDRDFKACLGSKAITHVSGDPDKLSLFEGYMDYLSWLRDDPGATDTVIVLNSVNLLQMAIDRASGYAQINLFFDRDKAGQAALDLFRQTFPHAADRSEVYKGYKDYNEMLMACPRSRLPWEDDHSSDKIKPSHQR